MEPEKKETGENAHGRGKHLAKQLPWILKVGVLLGCLGMLIRHTPLIQMGAMGEITDVALGAACGMIILGCITTGLLGVKLKNGKKKLLKRG